jgi:anti-anti-sigma regulatory factor
MRQDDSVDITERRRTTPALRAIPLLDRPGVRLVGEVDLASWDVLETALQRLPAGGDVHLELGQLDFIDAHGASILARTAQRLEPERRLVLHDPPPLLQRLLGLLWQDVPMIQMGNNA